MNARPFRRVADLLTSRARGTGPTPNRMSSRDRQALARLDVLRSSAPVENVPLDEAPARARAVAAADAIGARMLTSALAADPRGNAVAGPVGMALVLAMLYAGADASGTGIGPALGFDEAEVRDEPLPGARDRTWRAIQSCLQRFDTADAAALEGFDPGAIPDAPLLHVANNTLIIDEDTRIEQSYVDAVRRWYGSEVGRIGSDGAKAALDAWTALHTGGLIRRSAIRITPDTRLVLQNAILFAARWAKPFKAENTSKGASFTRADGGRTRADMMHITGSYTLVKGEGWRALRLPYATGAPDGAGTGIGTGIGDRRGTAGLAMDIILPDAVASPADLPPSTWGAATRALNRAERLPRGDFDVIVGLPRLDLNPGAVDLIPLLEELGIGIWGLELSHIAPRLILEQAFQQTRLLVDEAGTVAASLTEAAFMRGAVHAAPRRTKRFICDRPFVLRVVDLDSGAAVFEAAVLDPARRGAR
jgi:proteinase inhibitor I4 serpin